MNLSEAGKSCLTVICFCPSCVFAQVIRGANMAAHERWQAVGEEMDGQAVPFDPAHGPVEDPE